MARFFRPRESAARKALLAALPKRAVGVELGVWKGDFSAALLKATKPRRLHLIDPWQASEEKDRRETAWYGAGVVSQAEMDAIYGSVVSRFSREISSGQVVLHRASSLRAMEAIAADSVDYVYIDGDHSYAAVASDLVEAFRITRQNGMIACDDYFLGGWWNDGVVRAVHEFLESHSVIIDSKADTQLLLRKLAAS